MTIRVPNFVRLGERLTLGISNRIYATKKTITIIVYLSPIRSPKSCCIPATRASPKLVRSTREIEYIKPRIGRRRMSIRRLESVSVYCWIVEVGSNKHDFLLMRRIDTIFDLAASRAYLLKVEPPELFTCRSFEFFSAGMPLDTRGVDVGSHDDVGTSAMDESEISW